MAEPFDPGREWLEADGLGGFASGTTSDVRTRRYHGLLLTATTPPTGRVMLVNGFDAALITAHGRFAVTSQWYAPGLLHPEGAHRIARFEAEPWPRWVLRFEDGSVLEHERFVIHGTGHVVVRFRASEPVRSSAHRVGAGEPALRLELRPLCSGRDYHALQRENRGFRFDVEQAGERVRLAPYPDQPAIVWWSNAIYRHAPDWYRNFLYEEERARGLDCSEDLASPGTLTWDLSAGPAVWLLAAERSPEAIRIEREVSAFAEHAAERERARRVAFDSPLHRAAASYVVARGDELTLIAGYPWFTDWGRDTFIALRGLCLATGRLDQAERILLAWAGTVSQGMLPNRFPDGTRASALGLEPAPPEYNSVDASLWFVIAVAELTRCSEARGAPLMAATSHRLVAACQAILEGYSAGTRHGIRLDDDGLLAAGEPGVQLTWMDAKIGDWVVTPRIGKPVEVQALWLNALAFGAGWSARWKAVAERGRLSFEQRFWNEASGMLYDVVDVDHRPGTHDATLRPNQVLAVGGLPMGLLPVERARRVIERVQSELWTPLGLRSLGRHESGYVESYRGGPRERDASYHQGPVWLWLLGAFVEGYLRVHGDDRSARLRARERFLAPVLAELARGHGHLPELTDAEAPFTLRGCPFQAWSLGEALRLHLDVLSTDGPKPP